MKKKKSKSSGKSRKMKRWPKLSRKRLLTLGFVLVFASIGVYLLIQSFAASPSSPTATATCGARVQNYTYNVPFGRAIWNQPICGLPRHPQSADYAKRLYDWGNPNMVGQSNEPHFNLNNQPSFPEPTLLDPEGLSKIFSREVYYASEATTTTQVQSGVYSSNLDINLPYGDLRHHLPDARIPWNPAWRTGTAGDNEIVILDESNGRIYGISGLKLGLLPAVGQCGPLFRDRICAYHIEVGRDLNGNYIDYRTFEGFQPNRGVGLSYYATLVTTSELKAGEIRHAIGIVIAGTATGPICTDAQLGTTAEGKTCGTAVAPASKFEWGGVNSTVERSNFSTPALDALYTQEKLIPEGMLFAIDINDTEIESWINSRQDLKSNPRRAETARIFARALRDYGMMVADTGGGPAGIQTEGAVNPRTQADWKELGLGPEYQDNMLDGLITKDRLYVVDPPTLTCTNGKKSKYYCPWTSASYGGGTTPITDTLKPAVNVTSPLEGAKINGTAPVNATATDNVGVTRMRVLVDGQEKKVSQTGTITHTLDSAQLGVGVHLVKIEAYDAVGNVAEVSRTITVGPAKVADFNNDSIVDYYDLAVVLTNYRKNVPNYTLGDCDGNGYVDIVDLSMLITRYRK